MRDGDAHRGVSAPRPVLDGWPPAFAGHRAWLVVSALLAFAIAYALQADALSHRVCCDASGYWRIAGVYGSQGLFANHDLAGVRTWTYPMVLLLVSKFAAAIAAEPARTLFVLQFAAHVASSALLARVVLPMRPRAATMLFALLVCNPYASAYLGVALTDALALACFTTWLAAAVAWHSRLGAGRGGLAWFALAATMAGVACALRPAYVWLPVLTLLLALRPVVGRARAGAIVLAVLLPLLILAPQSAINRHLFDRATPLPTTNLAGKQLRWGIENLKYATAPQPGSSAKMFYANPLAGDPAGEEAGVGWYLRHPLRGSATLGAKLVAAFDFDFLPAYVWDRESQLPWPLRGLSLALLVLGLQGMWRYMREGGAQELSLGPRALPPLVFAGWAAVTLVTAVELRFTLPMMSLLLPLAFWFVGELCRLPRASRWWHLAVSVLAMAFAVAIANFVAAQNVLL